MMNPRAARAALLWLHFWWLSGWTLFPEPLRTTRITFREVSLKTREIFLALPQILRKTLVHRTPVKRKVSWRTLKRLIRIEFWESLGEFWTAPSYRLEWGCPLSRRNEAGPHGYSHVQTPHLTPRRNCRGQWLSFKYGKRHYTWDSRIAMYNYLYRDISSI